MSRIAIVGGNGQIARLLHPLLVDRGHTPVALVRREGSERVAEVTRTLFYSGLRYADRDPIGTEETLNNATAEGLKAFYQRWYRPDRATIVMVGDADPELIRQAGLHADRAAGPGGRAGTTASAAAAGLGGQTGLDADRGRVEVAGVHHRLVPAAVALVGAGACANRASETTATSPGSPASSR